MTKVAAGPWTLAMSESRSTRSLQRRSCRWWNRYSLLIFCTFKAGEKASRMSISLALLPWATICIPFGYICYAPRNARHPLLLPTEDRFINVKVEARPRFQFKETLISPGIYFTVFAKSLKKSHWQHGQRSPNISIFWRDKLNKRWKIFGEIVNTVDLCSDPGAADAMQKSKTTLFLPKIRMKIRLKTWKVHVWSVMIILANNLAIALTEQMMPKSTLCGGSFFY